jgi:hypothetical protein
MQDEKLLSNGHSKKLSTSTSWGHGRSSVEVAAPPLAFQRLEKATCLEPLLDQMEAVFKDSPR